MFHCHFETDGSVLTIFERELQMGQELRKEREHRTGVGVHRRLPAQRRRLQGR
jgi:hypothetical protein